jgi:hypothetical protein
MAYASVCCRDFSLKGVNDDIEGAELQMGCLGP